MQDNNRKSWIIGILIIALVIVSIIAVRKNPTDTPPDTSIQEGMKEFRNDEIGIAFMYPERYGDVVLEVTARDPNGVAPYNVKDEYEDGLFDITNLRYFQAHFTNSTDLEFGGGFICWGCEGGRYVGDLDFQRAEDYEKFYTNSGQIGLVFRGSGTPEAPCDPGMAMCVESIRQVYEGMYAVSFQVHTDYRGITFYAKDTIENADILKSLTVQ